MPDTDPDKERDIILSIEDLGVFYGHKQVVFDVSFDVGKAEVVALVGESGSGKTTISRCVGGLHKEWTGTIAFEGNQLGHGSRKRSVADRKRIQYIFQNPYLSLNPRLTIEQIVKRPMELFGIASGKAATERVVELLDQVALGPAVLKYQASRLSGGERQRVAIARALAAEPDVLVCDEITSALDVSVQGSIVALLESLRVSRGISMLFVTHNLALVRSIADRVQILNAGRVVESGSGRRGDGLPEGGVHQASAREQSAHRLMAASTQGHLETGRPRLSTMSFIDPQHDPDRQHVTVPRHAATAARRASCACSRRRSPAPAGRAISGPGSIETHTTALLVLDGPLGQGTRRARVVRRRRRRRLAAAGRLDDQVRAGPPRRERDRLRRPAARGPGRPSTCPSSPAPATPRAPSSTC